MKRFRMSRTISSIVIPPPWPIPWAIWAISPWTGAAAVAVAWPACTPAGARTAVVDDPEIAISWPTCPIWG